MIDREKYFKLIQSREWYELLKYLRDSELFNELLEDAVFVNVFKDNCINPTWL